MTLRSDRITSNRNSLVFQTTKEDILKLYGIYVQPKGNDRKLPDIPQIQILGHEDKEQKECLKKLNELKKQKYCGICIRCLKFSLHCLIVMFFLILGALAFATIEDPVRTNSVSLHAEYGNRTLLWLYLKETYGIHVNSSDGNQFLADMKIFLKAEEDVKKQNVYNKRIQDRQFIFTKWFYFVTIATTTIGYGDVTPKSTAGKYFYIFFSLIGIPLMVSLLASCGDMMTQSNKHVFGLIIKCVFKKTKKVSKELLSMISIIVAFLCYLAVGIVFNAVVADWTVIDSIYFWVVTFTTVGFGDLVKPLEVQVKYIAPLLFYRIFGLTLLAGVIDSAAAWLKARRKELKRKAQKAKGKSIMKSAFLEWLDNVSVADGLNETSRSRRLSNLSLPTARSANDNDNDIDTSCFNSLKRTRTGYRYSLY